MSLPLQMKRRVFLKQVSLAVSLPLVARTLPAAAAQAAAIRATSIHKILTCNVRVDVPSDAKTGDGWAQRREFCAEVMKSQKADLIGLQEAQLAHVTYLKSRMPEYDSFGLSHSTTDYHPINAILFLRERYELVSAGGFALSETPHIAASKSWDSANPRLVNWVHLKDRRSGREFRYWNTHLDHKGQHARERGAAMIVEASSVYSADLPQLLTGDMNAHVQNRAIATFKAGQWIDTYAAVNGPSDPGFTAHGFRGVNNPSKFPDGTPKSKIDWIFCRGPVKPLASAIIRDSRNGHYPSDHFFVSAEVSF